MQKHIRTWQRLASAVTHTYSLKAVGYAKVEHDFKMFELVLKQHQS
jgi:hypothetical protein